MSNINKSKVTKPKISNYKTSDRRLASGIRPELFLLSQQNNAKTASSSSIPQITPNNPIVSSTYQQSNIQNKKNGKGKKNNNYDPTADEWDPKHFRLFVGNLASDANDLLLQQVFGQYLSLSKVKVPINKATGQNNGYGFVAFSDPNDYLKAFKEQNGKYIGHNPCTLKKANDLNTKNNKNKNKNKR